MFVRFALVVISLAAWSACSGSTTTPPATVVSPSQNDATIVPVTPLPKPASVPDAAQAIERTTTLGRIVRRAGQDPQAVMVRQLLSATCNADVVVLRTSEETIYAVFPALSSEEPAPPCDRFWPPDIAGLYIGAQAALVLEVADRRFRLLIDTLAGAQSEFTVAGIWVE